LDLKSEYPRCGTLILMAIISFADKISEEICNGKSSKQTQKRISPELDLKAQIKLAILAAATNLSDLSELRGNRLEALKGERNGQFSIRVNNQYRICFEWNGTNAFQVEITDYH
jgi:toxin HigB-1